MNHFFSGNFFLISVFLMFFLFKSKFVVASDDGNFYSTIGVGFSADMVLYNERLAGREVKSVVLTSDGVRLKAEGLFGWDGVGVYITDFNAGVSWVVDVEKKIYAQLPKNKSDSEDADSGFGESGIMATKACLGATVSKKLETPGTQGGAKIEHFQCDYNGMATRQVYSLEYGVVIKEVMPSGHILQLQNMRKFDAGEKYFKPPAGYSLVELEEFYMGLPRY